MTALTQKQTQAIELLLGHIPAADVAETLHVSPRTIRRWQDTEAFKTAMQECRQRLFDQVVAKLAGLGVEAVSTMASIMRNKQNTAHVRLRAASEVLSHLFEARDQDLEQRLSELETAIEKLGQEAQA